MTYRDSEREQLVDELLLDAGLTDASDVRRALLSVGSFANLPAPAPGAELAAMLAGPHDEVTKRRWRRKHRTAVVSVAVVAAMGLGVSGVAAASSGFTRNPAFIDELLGNIAPQWPAAAPALPTPDAPKVSTVPAQGADPSALPPATPEPGIPVREAVTESQAQAQQAGPAQPVQPGAPVQAPEPAAPNQAAANPGTATQGKPDNGTPDNGKPDDAKPDNARPGQDKPGSDRDSQTPNTSPGDNNPRSNNPNNDKEGRSSSKAGPAVPSLTNQRHDEHFKDVMEKLKQWKKRGDS